jgi:hypothetical protein
LVQKTFSEQLDDPSIFIISCGPFEMASMHQVNPLNQAAQRALNTNRLALIAK